MMQNTKARKNLRKVSRPVSLEVGIVLSYLRANGVQEATIARILSIWNASFARREELYEQISKAYAVKNNLMAQHPTGGRDPHFFDELTRAASRIAALRGEIDLDEQQLWISIARESGCAEVAGGLQWVPTRAVIDAIYDEPVKVTEVEKSEKAVARISSVLKQLRKERGMTLEQVATVSTSLYPTMKEAHITAPHLHRAENAKTFLSPLKLMALSRVYGLPFDIFLARLDLKEFGNSLKDLARHLVIGIFGDVTSALYDKEIGTAEELVRLRRSFSTLNTSFQEVRLERDSLKRQIEFLEGEVKTLRKRGIEIYL